MIRKGVAAAVGIAQVTISALAVPFAYILNFDLFHVQALLHISTENASAYVLLLLFFGFFSMISGLSLIQEWQTYA